MLQGSQGSHGNTTPPDCINPLNHCMVQCTSLPEPSGDENFSNLRVHVHAQQQAVYGKPSLIWWKHAWNLQGLIYWTYMPARVHSHSKPLSRGAAFATLVELNRYIMPSIHRNCTHLGITDQCRIVRSDAIGYLKRYNSTPFDLIFADPPYKQNRTIDLPQLALKILKPGGSFVLEHDSTIHFAHHPSLDTYRAYGRTRVSLFRT